MVQGQACSAVLRVLLPLREIAPFDRPNKLKAISQPLVGAYFRLHSLIGTSVFANCTHVEESFADEVKNST